MFNSLYIETQSRYRIFTRNKRFPLSTNIRNIFLIFSLGQMIGKFSTANANVFSSIQNNTSNGIKINLKLNVMELRRFIINMILIIKMDCQKNVVIIQMFPLTVSKWRLNIFHVFVDNSVFLWPNKQNQFVFL